MLKKLIVPTIAAASVSALAYGASLPNIQQWDPTNATGSANSLIGSINTGVTPGSMAPLMNDRNLLDNGAMWVNQRAATATSATTSGCIASSYSADRWCGDVNMASGAGQLAVATSSPTPPIGFVNESTLVRNSGTLLQPQCALQELPTLKATEMQGQTVNFSVYAQALAALAADNNNLFNLYVFTGTGSAQGLGALRSAVGMTSTTKQSSFTISTSTGVITNATTVVAGQPVSITASTMPTGITSAATYYVSSNLLNSGTSFTIAPTYAAAIAGTNTVIPSTAGTSNVMNFPQITPVWTGLAVFGANGAGQGQSSVSQALGQAMAQTFSMSATNWGRFQTGPINIPANVTEAAVAICFTPANATTAGTSTDGLAFTGAQLEIMGPNQSAASSYAFKTPEFENAAALRYYFQQYDAAAHTALSGTGEGQSTTVCLVPFAFPNGMDIAPTYNSIGSITSSTFKVLTGTTETTISAAAAPSTNLTANSPYVAWVALTTTGQTAGSACVLTGQTLSTTVAVSFSADF